MSSTETHAWSRWYPVTDVLDAGWNKHDVPWKIGVYRFRVGPTHQDRSGEVIYVGRAATTKSSALCRRVGLFVSAAMGFYTQHSGGIAFYDKWYQHKIPLRSLEYSWALDDDPWCREYEEYLSYSKAPVLNARRPDTCGELACLRRAAILARLR